MDENFTLSENEENLGKDVKFTTPNSQKQIPSEIRRWASVVKVHNTVTGLPELNKSFSNKDVNREHGDCASELIQENLKNHGGFINLKNNLFSCQICSQDLDTVLSLTNHLKTRKHEDNIIVYLKGNMPVHLHHMLEFISFCNSNLCCNLCQNTIQMTTNPYETLMNIISHNTDKMHTNLKENHDKQDNAHSLLDSLIQIYPEIRENFHLVDKKTIPHFMCKLCKKNIPYNMNEEMLAKQFIIHFKGAGHARTQKALQILQIFDETSLVGKEKFSVVDGFIVCTVCNIQVDSDVQKLISHVQEVQHTTNTLGWLKLFSPSEEKLREENLQEKELNYKNEVSKLFDIVKNKGIQSNENVSVDDKLFKLINTLPDEYRMVDHLVENDRGSVTCLICDCIIPPCKHNVLGHLKGINHQRQVEVERILKSESINNQRIGKDGDSKPKLVSNSLRSLLEKLPKNLGKVNYIVNKNKECTVCLVCQRELPFSCGEIEEHLLSSIHIKMENSWLKNCPGCKNFTEKSNNKIKNIPKELRNYQCKKVEKISCSSFEVVYSLLLKKSTLISKNDSSVLKNIDGKHCYCRLCKSLIPISLNINVMEKNLTSHYVSNIHVQNELRKSVEELKINSLPLNSGQTSRSLPVSLNSDKKIKKYSEDTVCHGNLKSVKVGKSNENCKISLTKPLLDLKKVRMILKTSLKPSLKRFCL